MAKIPHEPDLNLILASIVAKIPRPANLNLILADIMAKICSGWRSEGLFREEGLGLRSNGGKGAHPVA